MSMHESSVGLAPAMTALVLVAAVVGSLWWNSREEPPDAAPATSMSEVTELAPPLAMRTPPSAPGFGVA